jgi:hypothetical protein
MQQGLADDLEKMSETCCVMVGVTESPLLERSRRFIAAPRTYYHLEKTDHDGAVVKSEDRP